jgi:tRNA(fMet)-specific endonuclease VapC
MTIYLIDSDWIIDWLKGFRRAVELLRRLQPAGMAISIMTFAEVYEGIYFGHDPPRVESVFQGFLRGVRVIPITRTVARRFALVSGDLRARGLLIPQPDILIAATALTYDLELVTRNTRHFQRIPGLRLYQG